MSIVMNNVMYKYMPGTPYEKTALDGVSLEIKDGEFVGLIGHTGSGKSTLIQHLNGLLKPTSGSILIDGVDITLKGVSLREIRQKVGLVFQYPEHQLFEETVYKDIAFGPINLGLTQEEIESRVKQTMKIVGLNYNEYKDKSPFELSGGQKRRVAIAGVLAMKPKVLILDEPTAGLDPRGRDEILENIKQLHKTQKMTIILVSHSMEDVAKLVDRIIVMNHGKVALSGTPREVFMQPEKLEKMGLSVPQVTYLVRKLKARGFNIRQDVITVEEAKNELLRCLKGRGK